MKSMTLLIMGLLLAVHVSHARPVSSPSYEQLFEASDLVAVVRYESSVLNTELLTSADPPPWISHLITCKYGPRDPDHYQGLTSKLNVVVSLKGAAENTIDLSHFATKAGYQFNGGFFMLFPQTDARVKSINISGHEKPIQTFSLRRDATIEYLAFLKKREDGVFVPVTGNYDASFSFKILAGQPHYSAFWSEELVSEPSVDPK